eukprot:GHVL01036643.1.p1 GENE.GHVL01036643.1~~GHVL01036643.1.p1  ORF type:complete len:262 (+),score=58.32 GHVL01036643.1:95-880(+)
MEDLVDRAYIALRLSDEAYIQYMFSYYVYGEKDKLNYWLTVFKVLCETYSDCFITQNKVVEFMKCAGVSQSPDLNNIIFDLKKEKLLICDIPDIWKDKTFMGSLGDWVYSFTKMNKNDASQQLMVVPRVKDLCEVLISDLRNEEFLCGMKSYTIITTQDIHKFTKNIKNKNIYNQFIAIQFSLVNYYKALPFICHVGEDEIRALKISLGSKAPPRVTDNDKATVCLEFVEQKLIERKSIYIHNMNIYMYIYRTKKYVLTYY